VLRIITSDFEGKGYCINCWTKQASM